MEQAPSSPSATTAADSQSSGEPVTAAGFWIRAAAHGVDMAVLTTVVAPISLYLAFRAVQMGQDPMDITGGMMEHYSIWWDILFTLGFMALVVLLWRTVQGTPGKKLCGLSVVDMHTGQKADSWRLSLRYIAYLASILPLGLGFFSVFWHPRNYAWHDRISGTTVIHKADRPVG